MSERITGCFEQPDELEQMLSRLKPQGGGVSRDQLMFLAGQQEVLRERAARRHWHWPVATAASWLMTAAVAGLWMQSLAEPTQPQLAHDDQPRTVVESPGRPDSSLVPAHPENQITLSPDSLKWQTTTPHTSPDAHGSRGDETGSWLRNHLERVDSLRKVDDLPRLSMVGWRSLQRARQQPEKGGQSPQASEPVVTQRASYADLMKLYLDKQAALGNEGGLL